MQTSSLTQFIVKTKEPMTEVLIDKREYKTDSSLIHHVRFYRVLIS